VKFQIFGIAENGYIWYNYELDNMENLVFITGSIGEYVRMR